MTGNRKLAAILAADVVGYSRLMQADEAGTFGPRFHDLFVIASNSSFAYKGKATRVQDVAGSLASVSFLKEVFSGQTSG